MSISQTAETFTKIATELREEGEATYTSWPQKLQLKLYGLYKQAKEGDATYETQPYLFQVKQRYKWNAWNQERGKSQEDAQKEYISLATRVLEVVNQGGDLDILGFVDEMHA